MGNCWWRPAVFYSLASRSPGSWITKPWAQITGLLTSSPWLLPSYLNAVLKDHGTCFFLISPSTRSWCLQFPQGRCPQFPWGRYPVSMRPPRSCHPLLRTSSPPRLCMPIISFSPVISAPSVQLILRQVQVPYLIRELNKLQNQLVKTYWMQT